MWCCEEGKIPLMFRCVADVMVNHAQYRLNDAIQRAEGSIPLAVPGFFQRHKALMPLNSILHFFFSLRPGFYPPTPHIFSFVLS